MIDKNNLEEMKREIITLLRKEEDIKNQIKNLENQLVQQFCPYNKLECEPGYFTDRITETCPFLQEWRNIMKEAQVR